MKSFIAFYRQTLYDDSTMILFLYGEDTFRSRRYLEQSIKKFKSERDPSGYNVLSLNGKKIESSRLFTEAASAPFLATKRLVIIEDILSSGDKDLLAELLEKIKVGKIFENNVVIFFQSESIGKTKEAKALYAALQKEKFAQEFSPLSFPKLVAWIKKEAEERKIQLSPEAVAYLAENGGDLWLLNGVLDQVRAFSNGAPVGPEEIKPFLNEKLDDNIFSMVEALVTGRRELGIKLLYEQRRLGQEDIQIFNLLLWQFRTLLSIADLVEREPGMPDAVVASKTGLRPFVVKKNGSVIRRYSIGKLRSLYKELEHIDVKTKTGQADPALLLDVFAGKL